jgi:hypothetical protein
MLESLRLKETADRRLALALARLLFGLALGVLGGGEPGLGNAITLSIAVLPPVQTNVDLLLGVPMRRAFVLARALEGVFIWLLGHP